jgi:two-component system, OmpR family, alkaline phosphatase synthesis response regulator PhoP
VNKEKVLVVDDEEDILELISYNLHREGYQVTTSETGEDAVAKAFTTLPQIIILDLMLPGLDGLEVCKQLKSDERTKGIPIIMVTAKGEEADIVAGLELGADDYLTKPFSPRVLLARIKTVLRRRKTAVVKPDEAITIGELVLHPGRHEVQCHGNQIELTLTEFRILHLFMQKPGWVFTRYQIVEAARGENYFVTDRSVDVQIVGLRRKLGECGDRIETVRGVGYRFKDI